MISSHYNAFIAHSRQSDQGIDDNALRAALAESLQGRNLKKVLLVPPDATRLHSYAGKIAQIYYELLKDSCHIDVMPALGTHEPMSRQECESFLGLPYSSLLVHNWRDDVVKLGEVPADFVAEISEGLMDKPIAVEVNKRLLDPDYDLILSIGQVVPHEVAGMANYSKNIFVGLGGSNMINSSHMLGAFYGMERIMGRADTPVRKIFDYGEEQYIARLPILYVLTVTTEGDSGTLLNGLYIGRGRELFDKAAEQSRRKNLTFVDKPLTKAVVYLDEHEFKSTWLGNKAIYRTRMAMADGGELIILAPGVKRFGEDDIVDGLIRKYGYKGRKAVLQWVRQHEDIQGNLSAAAHLIHGSSEGRFSITYATEHLTRQEVEGAGYGYMPLSEALQLYNPKTLQDGPNQTPQGSLFYISNPALGLWAVDVN